MIVHTNTVLVMSYHAAVAKNQDKRLRIFLKLIRIFFSNLLWIGVTQKTFQSSNWCIRFPCFSIIKQQQKNLMFVCGTVKQMEQIFGAMKLQVYLIAEYKISSFFFKF